MDTNSQLMDKYKKPNMPADMSIGLTSESELSERFNKWAQITIFQDSLLGELRENVSQISLIYTYSTTVFEFVLSKLLICDLITLKYIYSFYSDHFEIRTKI